MKKKIMIFMLLLSFLVGMGVPDQAKAQAEITESGFHFSKSSGYIYHDDGYSFQVSEDIMNDVSSGKDVFVFLTNSSSYKIVSIYTYDPCYSIALWKSGNTFFHFINDDILVLKDDITTVNYETYKVYLPTETSEFSFSKSVSYKAATVANEGTSDYKKYAYIMASDPSIIYHDKDILNAYYTDKIVSFVPGDVYKYVLEYTLEEFCLDYGLSNVASSNEVDSVIPYWYEPSAYSYVVRRNQHGQYLLTMIQKNEDTNFPVYYELETGGVIGLGSSATFQHTMTVRNFIYDTSGSGWLLQERQDVTFTDMYLDTNCFLDGYTLLLYTDSNIYTDSAKSSLWCEGSRAISGGISVVTPTPTPTPTSTPAGGGSGSGSSGGGTGGGTRPEGGSTVGGQAEPGGMLDFIITFFTLVWTKLFAVEVPVDGYNISFQAIVIFGAIAGVLIWLGKSSFGKKG